MACEIEDDAQVERQIQISLQRAVGDSINSNGISGGDQTPSVNSAEGTLHAGPADAVILDAASSQQTAARFPPGHYELSDPFGHVDTVKPLAEEVNQRDCLDDSYSNRFGDFYGSPAYLSFASNALDMNGRMREKADMATNTHSCKPLSPVQSDLDVRMTSASNPRSDVALTDRGTAVTPAVTLPIQFSRTTSSPFMNPWSKFAAAAGHSGLARHPVPAVPCGENTYSTIATRMEPESDNVNNQHSLPSLLNEHVSQNRTATKITQLRDENKLVAGDPKDVLTRPSINLLNENFRKPSDITPADRGAKVNGIEDRQNGFFSGIRPRQLTTISNRKAPVPADNKSQLHGGDEKNARTSRIPKSMTPSTSQCIGKTPKKKPKARKQKTSKKALQRMSKNPACSSKAKQHDPKTEGTVSGISNPTCGLKNLSQVGFQFAIDGIESFKQRYAHLEPLLAPSKEWFFAWQEIAAVLRTHYSYDYILWNSGFLTQLNTDFKVFKLRGPFKDKIEGRYTISKRAVLHVIDGPYFFRQAAPALADFCRANRLAAPKYSHYLHPDGSCACKVRIGDKSSEFGDGEEGYINRTDAEEDVAKTAMNALYRGGVLMDMVATINEAPAALQCRSEPQRPKKRKARSSEEGDYPAFFSRILRNDARQAQNPADWTSDDQNNRTIEAGSDADNDIRQVDDGASFESTHASERTRAGLAQVLKGALEPSERVRGKFHAHLVVQPLKVDLVMCEYLMLPVPEYWTEGHSGSGKWWARFLSHQFSEKSAQTLIAPITVTSANGLQDCAKLVENKLFEEIYSGEIRLGDGGTTFPDPTMQDERLNQYFARLRPRTKRRLEMDEGLTLEEISRRIEGADGILVPPLTNHSPLGVVEMPSVQTHGMHQDTRYESEDALRPKAIVLADTDENVRKADIVDPSNAPQLHRSRRPRTPPTGDASEENGNGSVRHRISGKSTSDHVYDLSSTYVMLDSVQPEQQPRLLSSGEHPYVSPPPFLDTPTRPSRIGPSAVKAEPLHDDDQNGEVVLVGERPIEERDGFPAPTPLKNVVR